MLSRLSQAWNRAGPETCSSFSPTPLYAWDSLLGTGIDSWGYSRLLGSPVAATKGWRTSGAVFVCLFFSCGPGKNGWVGGPLEDTPSPCHASASVGWKHHPHPSPDFNCCRWAAWESAPHHLSCLMPSRLSQAWNRAGPQPRNGVEEAGIHCQCCLSSLPSVTTVVVLHPKAGPGSSSECMWKERRQLQITFGH